MAVVFESSICDEVRRKFEALADNTKYYEADLERLKIDDVYVSRFLTHQKEDKDEAAKMIDSVFTWRKQQGIRELDYSNTQDEKLKCLFFRNKDNEGNGILWMEVKPYIKAHREEYQKYLMWLVENREGESESSQITCVLALSDVGVTESDVEFIKFFINLFMYYTPDTMKRIVIHNMHWLLNGVWKMVSVLLSEGAKKRVIFAKNTEIYNTLPKESVVAACGGPDSYWGIPRK